MPIINARALKNTKNLVYTYFHKTLKSFVMKELLKNLKSIDKLIRHNSEQIMCN